jgi:hypothetical protein
MKKNLIILILFFSLFSEDLKKPQEIISLGEKMIYEATVLSYGLKADVYFFVDSTYSIINNDTCFTFIFSTKINQKLVPIKESLLKSFALKSDLTTKRIEQYVLKKDEKRVRIINFLKDSVFYEKDLTIKGGVTSDFSNIFVENKKEVKDMISIFFYLRLIDYENLIGKTIYLWSFSEAKRSAYQLPIKVLGKERIEVKAGSFECIVIRCLVKQTKIFSSENGDITLWIAYKDKRRPIVKFTKEHKVGFFWYSINFELKEVR